MRVVNEPEIRAAAARLLLEGDVTKSLALLRYAERMEHTADCWEWLGVKRNGYGRACLHGKMLTLHRFVYECLVGPITEETLDHLCKNRACCNPAHLEPVSLSVNIKRGDHTNKGWRRMRTECPRGHPYDEANTAIRPDGSRRCRKCDTERKVERRKTDPEFLERERRQRRESDARSRAAQP